MQTGIGPKHAAPINVAIRARFGSTVCALVTLGLGIAIIDEYTLAANNWPNIRALDIVEPTVFQTYIVHRKDTAPSVYGARFITALRTHMEAVGTSIRAPRRISKTGTRGQKK